MIRYNTVLLPLIILLITGSSAMAQKVVQYQLVLEDTVVRYGGKEKRAIAANGQIPMPTLEFTQGDTAEIVVYNRLKENTAIHWHGLFLPNKEDGIPHLTQMPIKPGESFTYRFPITQTGTHWYHSHAGMQEQIGMYGNFIMHKRDDDESFRKGIDDLPSLPIVLSEWTNLKPENVQRMLHAANDWFAIKKGAVQSYAEAIASGHFKTKLTNEWKRMLAMDVSDVYYDRVLMNGNPTTELKSIDGKPLKAGDQVRLRISNGGASSYFWLRYAGGKMRVVASDGNDVEPVEVDRLIIAVSETYDVVVTIPEDGKAFEFMATTEDRSQSTSYFIGDGEKQYVGELPGLKYFEGMRMMNDMMKMNGDLDDMGMEMSLQQMDMNVVMYPEITGETKKHGEKGSDEDHTEHNHHTHQKHGGATKNKEQADHDRHAEHQQHQHNHHELQKQKDAKKNQEQAAHDKHAEHQQHQHSQHAEHADTKREPQDQGTPGHADHHMNHDRYDANALSDIVTLNYGMLKSPHKTTLPEDAPVKELRFELTGNMNRYVWSMDNRILAETDKIPVKKGEVLRITIYNNSMMRHPMHLHGFDFRVLNKHGDYAPMKNIIDIMPMETDTIEFLANNQGDWFFHCHILYHMMAGMNRVFAVDDYQNPYLPDKEKAYRMLQHEHNMPHFTAQSDFATNGIDGEAMLMNARYSLTTEWRLGFNDMHGYEVETHLGRHIGKMQWLMPFIGIDWRYRKMDIGKHEKNLFGQTNTKNNRTAVSLGVRYTLPMLIDAQAEVYHDGIVRLSLMREDIPLSARLRGGFMVNTDLEYMTELRYILTRHLGVRAHYDSDMGFGVGLALQY